MLLLKFIDLLFQIYTVLLFARIIGSWVPEFQRYRLMQFVAFYTDPYLNFFRRIIPPFGMLDLSPLFAFFCLGIIKSILERIILGLL